MAYAALFAMPASAQSNERVEDIVIEGNQRIEDATVRSYMSVSVGDRYDPGRVNASLKALFDTGLFADVTIRRDGGALIVRVVENPIINRISFEGNRRISDDALQAEVQLRPRIVYTRARVQSDVQRIAQVYRASGRFAATVEPKVIQLPQNRIDLVFEINEGDVTGISKIRFVGNRAYSDSRLSEAIATRETRWYRFLSSSDNYDPDRLTFDRELLRKFYLSRGYADFRVISAVAELTPDKKDFFITFTIDEGKKYTFGKIDIASTLKDLDTESLRALLLTEEGDTYDAEAIEDSIQKLTFEIGQLGYAFVDIRPKVERDRENLTIGLTYQIDEGPRVYVERINITGNVRTLDRVIRREFRMVEGDAFNTAKLRRSQQRIRALGFFEKAEVTQEPGSAPDRTIINVDVQEQSTGELSIGAGFSTSESVVGDISIRERNLLGRGQNLKVALGISTKRQQIDLGFTEPYFLDRELAAGFDLFNIRRDLQDRSGFDQRSTGLVLRARFPILERLDMSTNYTVREDEVTDVDDDASRLIKSQEGTRLTSSVGYDLTYDQRDDSIEPHNGYVLVFGQEFAGIGGDIRYLKNDGRFVYYTPLFTDDLVLSLGANVGYIFGIGEDVELFSRYFIGGETFRGFKSGGIGPRDKLTGDSLGGNMYYVGTASIRFPLPVPNEFNIKGRLFTDVGTITDVDESGPEVSDSSMIRASVGVGFDWVSPFGPIRVDLAYPVVKSDEDKTEIFRFSFGTRF
ncbi:outer membrane protein assembly factor BamA [Oceanibacterium hippocampi]|uniref:Outer membrane protein assembly factor BamA n=1 Tax=Oceanibacterium hippocampi TaxID=745714 RepID=A0A1Y5T1U9_9PROT|nr:outer membrane protein assembly factor BamA [Oceanibacterium hippocampi]SLN54073.1 Outer membrane protein assembly factor BamA precursor [Oceanibacterium hippocampi]